MFDKAQLQARIDSYLAANPVRAENPEMQLYMGIIAQSGNMGQLVLKNIHGN